MKYEIWEDDEGCEITLRNTKDSLESCMIGNNAKMVHSFEANSYNEACQKQYDYYGWGVYKPMD